MAQLVAALFETRARAEEALTALVGTGIARDRLQIIGDDEGRGISETSEIRELSAGAECSAALRRLRLPEEDASAFAAACGGGGAVLALEVEEAAMDEAVQVIETFEPIDLDSRTEEHRTAESGGAAGADAGSPLAAGLSAGGIGGQTNTGALPGMGAMTDGTDDLGSGDLRTREVGSSDMGLSSTTATGARRDDERAGAPGTLELGDKPDLVRREKNRVGRVRFYGSG